MPADGGGAADGRTKARIDFYGESLCPDCRNFTATLDGLLNEGQFMDWVDVRCECGCPNLGAAGTRTRCCGCGGTAHVRPLGAPQPPPAVAGRLVEAFPSHLCMRPGARAPAR